MPASSACCSRSGLGQHCAVQLHIHLLTPVTGTASRWHLLKQDSLTHRCECQHEGQKGQQHQSLHGGFVLDSVPECSELTLWMLNGMTGVVQFQTFATSLTVRNLCPSALLRSSSSVSDEKISSHPQLSSGRHRSSQHRGPRLPYVPMFTGCWPPLQIYTRSFGVKPGNGDSSGTRSVCTWWSGCGLALANRCLPCFNVGLAAALASILYVAESCCVAAPTLQQGVTPGHGLLAKPHSCSFASCMTIKPVMPSGLGPFVACTSTHAMQCPSSNSSIKYVRCHSLKHEHGHGVDPHQAGNALCLQ